MHDQIEMMERQPDDRVDALAEERKATGRLVAVLVALFLIFLAIYHAWIRKTAVLAGILVPALIMVIYGGWVVFLARREKKRRLLMARQAENMLNELSPKSSSPEFQDDSATSPIVANSRSYEYFSMAKEKRNRRRKTNPNPNFPGQHNIHRWKNRRHHFFRVSGQTEALLKSRREGVPLSRTCSAP